MTFRVVLAAMGEHCGSPIIADALVHSAGDVNWTRCDERAFYLLTRALAALPKMTGGVSVGTDPAGEGRR